jgi:hypothetical protein
MNYANYVRRSIILRLFIGVVGFCGTCDVSTGCKSDPKNPDVTIMRYLCLNQEKIRSFFVVSTVNKTQKDDAARCIVNCEL